MYKDKDMTVQTIEIDISHEFPLETLQEITNQYNLKSEVISVNGPAGGNPLISLTGTRNHLSSFLMTEYLNDIDDVELYLNRE